jgi:hypothetical protein
LVKKADAACRADLDPRGLAELKAMAKPADMIKSILGMLAEMLGHKSDWASIQKMLGNPKAVVKALHDYNRDNIPDRIFNKISGFLARDTVSVENARKVSAAAAIILSWITAVFKFSSMIRQYGHEACGRT